MSPPADGSALDRVGDPPLEELEAAARQQRRLLWERHARLRRNDSDEGLDQDTVDELFALTDAVLGLERSAAEFRGREAHRRSSRWIYIIVGVLITGSAAALTIGPIFREPGGLGTTTAVITIVVGLVLAAGHAVAAAQGHCRRLHAAIVVVLACAVLAGAAVIGALPAWISVLVLLLAAAGVFVSTVRIKQRGDKN